MCTYLERVGSTYYFRRIVPADLRPLILTSTGEPRSEWKISLRTKDRDEAKRAIHEHAIETDKQMRAAAERWLYEDETPEEGALKFYHHEDRPALREALRMGWINLPDVKGGPGGALLTEAIIDCWARERKPTAKGKEAYAAVARWFYERVGEIPVHRISRQHVIKFKDKLLAEGHTVANVNRKLNRLRTLLEWAVDNDYAEKNAGQGITIKVTAPPKDKRLPFSLADLNTIFSSPVFAEGKRPAQGKGAAAYWIPLLALFTGARLEEIGQLRIEDIQHLPYPDADGETLHGWFIHITESGEGGLRLKTASSERLVPVHAELQRLGFLRYVDGIKAQKQMRLFPGLQAGAYGRLTHKWGQWFSSYLRDTCSITDKRKVFHSFRHTFKDICRNTGMDEGIQRRIMGHAGHGPADNYGSGWNLHKTTEAMALVKIPGLALP